MIIKPNIVISKCINIDNCRYNWDKVNDEFLKKLWKYVNFLPVCPEVSIWLWTPRMPVKLYWNPDKDIIKMYQSSKKIDLTEKMNNFSIKYLNALKEIDWFIMKNRSPSCWIKDVKVYPDWESKIAHWKSSWLFVQNIEKIFQNYPMEDEGRLKNFRIRESFLTKIFCLAKLREILKNEKINELQNFQAENKYLFMSYSPKYQIELWRIIASYDKTNFDIIKKQYHETLLKLFATKNDIWKVINAFTHIFWYFKNTCKKEEKDFFLETLDLYRDWRIPTSSIINILNIWAIRDKQEYILKQTILNPYPKELLELSDSWKILKL